MDSYFLRIKKISLDDLDRIVLFIEETTEKLEVHSEFIPDVVVTTMEAVTNILKHGYRDEPGLVEIEIKRKEKALVIVFRDLAETFDPTVRPAPDTSLPLEQRPMGGLGVYLMNHFMDELVHQTQAQGGNELICIKKDIFP